MAVVLIVEDDEPVRVLAESIIAAEGHETLTAADAEEARHLIDSDQAIDALFVDIRLGMENHAGLTLAQEGVAARPGLAVLYTTGTGVTDGMRAMFVDRFHFLGKPYTADQLAIALVECLRT